MTHKHSLTKADIKRANTPYRANILLLPVILLCAAILGCSKPSSQFGESSADSSQAQNSAEPEVLEYRGLLVSNYPLLLMAQEATRGIENPRMILPKNETGHHITMSPSVSKDIQESRIIYWFGAEMETTLAQALSGKTAVALLDTPEVAPIPRRDEQKNPIPYSKDPHVWLDLKRAAAIVRLIAERQAKLHPADAERYQDNAERFAERVNALLGEYQPAHKPDLPKAYISYHDAYQYMEPYLHMRHLGSIVKSSSLPIKPKRLLKLKQQKQNLESSVCILTEHIEVQARIDTLKPYRITLIDPSMSQYDDYISAWQSIANQVRDCLGS